MDEKTEKTKDLMAKLASCDNNSALDEYVDSIEGKYQTNLSQYIKEILERKNMSIADLHRTSLIDRNYIYQIMDGSKKPGRDKIVAIAICAGMSLEECQQALEISKEGILYPKSRRDSVIIYAINNKLSIMDLNSLLEKYNVPVLQ
jgi:transcriptional regulator with XRE-family HTH domain